MSNEQQSPDRQGEDHSASPNKNRTGLKTQNTAADQSMNEKMQVSSQLRDELDRVIDGLDVKLDNVLKKQEEDYLKGYTIYVKQKEKELQELIVNLNERNKNTTLKDTIITNLKKSIQKLNEDQIQSQKDKDQLKSKIKYWQTRSQAFEQDKKFLQSQVYESKRQNKLLKIAIARLQGELTKKDEEIVKVQQDSQIGAASLMEIASTYGDRHAAAQGGGGQVFMTEAKIDETGIQGAEGTPYDGDVRGSANLKAPNAVLMKQAEHGAMRGKTSPRGNEFSQLMALDAGTTAQTSYFESKLTMSKRLDQKRAGTRSPSHSTSARSTYLNLPTKNVKFEKFTELMFASGMATDKIQEEVVKYVQALETNYCETIKDLKILIEKERMKKRKSIAETVNQTQERNEMETLFVGCIEEVRKDIMKRRLKNEIYNRKKFQQFERNSQEAKEFEDSLLKLAQLAKNRVKISDFTSRDKSHLLDLFVNNEKTLLNIYEALFPHRATSGIGTFSQQAAGNQFAQENQLPYQTGATSGEGNRSASHFGGNSSSGHNNLSQALPSTQVRYQGHTTMATAKNQAILESLNQQNMMRIEQFTKEQAQTDSSSKLPDIRRSADQTPDKEAQIAGGQHNIQPSIQTLN